jgi:putative flippase GtrA
MIRSQLPAFPEDTLSRAVHSLRMGVMTKFVRYAGVSAISTFVSLTILGILVASGEMSAAWANVAATVAGTIPSFELNRRWVWNRTGPRSLLREVGPFSALSMLSLALSTLAVGATAGWVAGLHADATIATLVAETAHLGTFGLLWIVQYLLLDRLLFRALPRQAERGPWDGVEPVYHGDRPECVKIELMADIGGVPVGDALAVSDGGSVGDSALRP